jgi:hypothetical protein
MMKDETQPKIVNDEMDEKTNFITKPKNVEAHPHAAAVNGETDEEQNVASTSNVVSVTPPQTYRGPPPLSCWAISISLICIVYTFSSFCWYFVSTMYPIQHPPPPPNVILHLFQDRTNFQCEHFTGVMHHKDTMDSTCNVIVMGSIGAIKDPGHFARVVDMVPVKDIKCSLNTFDMCKLPDTPMDSIKKCCFAKDLDIQIMYATVVVGGIEQYTIQIGDKDFSLTTLVKQEVPLSQLVTELAPCAYHLDWSDVQFTCARKS